MEKRNELSAMTKTSNVCITKKDAEDTLSTIYNLQVVIVDQII